MIIINNNNNRKNSDIPIDSFKNIVFLKTVSLHGWDLILTDVEITITPGIPSILIVGLPNKTVNESRERIRSILNNMGISMPIGRIIINLSPADVLKEGTHYDLAILCGLLIYLKYLKIPNLNEYLFFGELQLNGDIINTYGALPSAIYGHKKNFNFIGSLSMYDELKAIKDYENKLLLFNNIVDLIAYFKNPDTGKISIPYSNNLENIEQMHEIKINKEIYNIYLSSNSKRLLEIAMTGRFNFLLIGPPGVGKTTIAQAVHLLLPNLSYENSLEVSSLYSICGLLKNGLINTPPIRMPHATSSIYSLLGGGHRPKPGEVSLAHHGILFLDEVNNFLPEVLDGLRECLTDKIVRLSRVNYMVSYPANFQLICAMNPCKCGFYGSEFICSCSFSMLEKYKQKISGPFLQRIPIKFYLSGITYDKIPSEEIWFKETKLKIQNAIEKHKLKFNILKEENICNIPINYLENLITEKGQKFLHKYAKEKHCTLRVFHNIIRIAYTISLLDNKDTINEINISEAVFFIN